MDWITTIVPDGITVLVAVAIVIISFFTAFMTAAFGIGGGLVLLAAMTALMPTSAIVPVHGAAQLGSNFSRFFFLRHQVLWPIIGWFSVGSLLGASLGGKLVISLNETLLQIGISLFIIISVWAPLPKSLTPGRATFLGTGIIGSFLTMFFGATGPIVATMLSAAKLDRFSTVATHAAAMSVQQYDENHCLWFFRICLRRVGIFNFRDIRRRICRVLCRHAHIETYA